MSFLKSFNLRGISNLHKGVFAVLAAFFFYTALNSHGAYHPDEHFQLIEFANYKLGETDSSELAWEFHNQIRPTIQVAVATAILGTLRACGMENPYYLVNVLRLITAILTFLTLILIGRNFSRESKDPNTYLTFFIIGLSFWYMPYLGVRFSSETWSAILLLIVVWLSSKKERFQKHALTIGLLVGFSFFIRFQMAFAFAGWVLWLLLVLKPGKSFWKCTLGVIIAAVVCTLSDTWFYGEFVISPWQYFKFNILYDVASSFGVSPWYWYFTAFIDYQGRVAGFISAIIIIYFVIKNPKNQMVWLMVPFVFFHCIVPHKELRFLFPLAFFIPFIIAQAVTNQWKLIAARKWSLGVAYLFLGGLVVTNVAGMTIAASMTGSEEMAIKKHLFDHYNGKQVVKHHLKGPEPYENPNKLQVKPLLDTFYKQKNVKQLEHNSFEEMANHNFDWNKVNLIHVYVRDTLLNDFTPISTNFRVELEVKGRPDEMYEHKAIYYRERPSWNSLLLRVYPKD